MGILNRFRRTQAPIAIPSPLSSPPESIETKASYGDLSLDLPVVLAIKEEDLVDSDNAALDVVADMLYRSCWPLGWMPYKQVESDQWLEEVILGVSIRSEDGNVRSCPAEHDGLTEFEIGVGLLHATVAIKFTCKAVEYMVKYHL